MKCNNCGFKYNGPENKCPYCGNYQHISKNILNKKINFFDIVEISVLHVILLLLLNIFVFFVIINLFFIKQSSLYVYVGVSFAVLYTVLMIVSAKKDLVSILRKIDFIITISLIIWLLVIESSKYLYEYVVPVYVFIMLIIETVGMFLKQIKLSRCYSLTVWHVVQITLPFIFLQLRLFSLGSPSVGGYFIITVFILSLFFLANNTLLLFLSINTKVREWLK